MKRSDINTSHRGERRGRKPCSESRPGQPLLL